MLLRGIKFRNGFIKKLITEFLLRIDFLPCLFNARNRRFPAVGILASGCQEYTEIRMIFLLTGQYQWAYQVLHGFGMKICNESDDLGSHLVIGAAIDKFANDVCRIAKSKESGI